MKKKKSVNNLIIATNLSTKINDLTITHTMVELQILKCNKIIIM